MKPTLFRYLLQTLFMAFASHIVVILVMSPVYCQQTSLIAIPSSEDNSAEVQTTFIAGRFQAAAFPLEDTQIIKVIFEDWSGRDATLILRDKNSGQILIKEFITTKQYMGKFDLSYLPDGLYSLEITADFRRGASTQKYVKSFKLQSHTQRSLSGWDSALAKRLYKPRNYQVHK